MCPFSRFALLMMLAITTEIAMADRSIAQTAPSIYDDAAPASMSADDLFLDDLNYRAEPPVAIEPLPFLFSMQSRRQRANDIEIESLTIELNDPVLPIHQQRSGFTVSSPIQ